MKSKEDIQKAINYAIPTMPYGKSICRVRLFGSYLHGDQKPESDIDLIIDFDKDASIGLFALSNIEDAFHEILQCKVDIVTPGGLKRYIRDKVLSEAETIYERNVQEKTPLG